MIFPITFSIPAEKIITEQTKKDKLVSNLIPGDTSTYIYDNETDYYNEYKRSKFAITTKKAGWDCLRHYEIMANGCLPIFKDIDKCPEKTLTLLPKDLLKECNNLYENYDDDKYNKLSEKVLDFLKNNLTTSSVAKYILEKTNHQNASKILFLSGDTNPDYLRCLTLHGFKETFGKNCHEYPKIPHLYKSKDIDFSKLYGKGMTYTNLLDEKLYDNDVNVIENIKNKVYDIVIYGSYHRGVPYYDTVKKIYKPNEIILLCGEDIHQCDYNFWLKKEHHVFVRELS